MPPPRPCIGAMIRRKKSVLRATSCCATACCCSSSSCACREGTLGRCQGPGIEFIISLEVRPLACLRLPCRLPDEPPLAARGPCSSPASPILAAAPRSARIAQISRRRSLAHQLLGLQCRRGMELHHVMLRTQDPPRPLFTCTALPLLVCSWRWHTLIVCHSRLL